MRRWAGLAIALMLGSCAHSSAPLPIRPVASGPAITIMAAPVEEYETTDGQTHLTVYADGNGGFYWAGGLNLTSPDTSRLHGLSDLKLLAGGQVISVSDDGDLLRARLVLDAAGRPVGLADATLTQLTDPSGASISGQKRAADAEGVAVLANGDRLISFERDHRIWLYPAGGGPPRAVPSPAAPPLNVAFPDNGGMEALAPDPARGRDAYVVGGEEDGRTWLCRLSTGCQAGPTLDLPRSFALTAVTRLSRGRTAWLLRAFDPLNGARAELRITDAALRTLDSLDLKRPASVDNMEGIAAVEGENGAIRFYLLADDNFLPQERTLLLAYDWRPADRRKP